MLACDWPQTTAPLVRKQPIRFSHQCAQTAQLVITRTTPYLAPGVTSAMTLTLSQCPLDLLRKTTALLVSIDLLIYANLFNLTAFYYSSHNYF